MPRGIGILPMRILTQASMPTRRFIEAAVLFLAAIIVAAYYRQSPTLGDDIEYWGLALDLHQGVANAWNPDSFHHLRWPVWGVCWILQFFVGYGSAGYFLQPTVYLGAGTILAFHLASRTGLPGAFRWAAAILFLLHPLLDASISRPMPDLSEGFWVAMSFFVWMHLVEASGHRRKILISALLGLAITCAQANRITGILVVPVLVGSTLILYRRAFWWLVLAGAFTLLFVGIEAAVFHSLTGDWLHSLHANLGARGRKGTEAMALWEFPIRFFPMLWKMPPDIAFSLLALLGLGFAGTRLGRAGRSMALFAILYYLAFSCAVQSISPLRPLVRDGERFLASMAYPLSVLSAAGLLALGLALDHLNVARPVLSLIRRHVAVALALLALLAFAGSMRSRDDSRYLDAIAGVLHSTADGTRVFSHDVMRYVSFLADPGKAQRLEWTLTPRILNADPSEYSACDVIWLVRKHAWIRDRKRSENTDEGRLDSLAPFLTPPLSGWKITHAIPKGNVPDFLFLERSDAVPLVNPPGLDGLLPSGLPWTWTNPSPGKITDHRIGDLRVPPELRGRRLLLWFKYSSNRTEPLRLRAEFHRIGESAPILSLLFKPYFFSEPSPDFFALEIPAEADSLTLILRTDRKAETIRLDDWKALIF